MKKSFCAKRGIFKLVTWKLYTKERREASLEVGRALTGGTGRAALAGEPLLKTKIEGIQVKQ